MKTPSLRPFLRSLALLGLTLGLLPASAGLTLEIHVQRYQNGYLFYTPLSTNSLPPAAPLGNYLISSPQQPSNGTNRRYELTPAGLTLQGGSSWYYASLEALMAGITNGNWRVTVTNAVATNEYTFQVTAQGFTGDLLPMLNITYPTEGDMTVPVQPTFAWEGAETLPGYLSIYAYQRDADYNWTFSESAYVPTTQTTWPIPVPIPLGRTYFATYYSSNHATALWQASTPLHTVTAQPLSGWATASGSSLYHEVGFTVSAGTGPGSHQLVAHYAFDQASNLGRDTSPNDNQINGSSSWGVPEHTFSPDAVAGAGAIRFFGQSSLAPPQAVVTSLAGSFTVSAWIKTTQSEGNDDDWGPYSPAVVQAFTGWDEDCAIPIALTGDKAVFYTGGMDFDEDSLHSTSTVNTGEYVHVAVTRNQATGQKKIYVNGVLEGTSTSHTRRFEAATEMFDLGVGGYPGFDGWLDDLQFYTGVLSAAQIAALYADPGSTIPDGGGGDPLGGALNAPNLVWTTGGNADWFAQTTVTHDAVAAAQSGAIDDSQASYVETTVIGPGTLSFWWLVSSERDFDFLEFYINDDLEAAISGEEGWSQYSLELGSGPHTLRWRYAKDSSNYEGADAAWLDEVQFSPNLNVEMDFRLEIIREQDLTGGEFYLAFPFFDSISPIPLTRHRVESPGGSFHGLDGGEYSASSRWMPSLESVIHDCTNGLWRLTINEGDPSERVYTFAATFNGLTTNVLTRASVIAPANGASGVPTNPPFLWTGPASFTSIYVSVSPLVGSGGAGTSLSSAATQWTTAPALQAGTNRFNVRYFTSGNAYATYTTPVDAQSNPVAQWSANTTLTSVAGSHFVVGGTQPALQNPVVTPGGIRFDFVTQVGQNYVIEARASLTEGAWTTVESFVGTGGMMQFTFPTDIPPTRYFRVRTN